MLKTIKLALNAFPAIPPSLTSAPGGRAAAIIAVNLADLYHHYYIDGWGVVPPDPDPAHFEHVRYLMPGPEFRFSRHGQGTAKNFKGNKSNELGQAFCRWFLSEHLHTDYIAHIEHVRDHGALAAHGGVSVQTRADLDGNGPDYFCASATNEVCLAEAKGTRHAVGFGTREFQAWRDQFDRVQVLHANGQPLSVKGYIVAMRWAMETDGARISTKLSAEDPDTRGERPLGEDRFGLAYAIKSIHYASTLQRLRQPPISAALLRGFLLPDDLQFQFVVWQCLLPTLRKMRFVGGYFPGPGGVLPLAIGDDGKLIITPADPFRLDVASGTFFGLEESVLRTLVATARNGPAQIGELRTFGQSDPGFSGVSLLRDGHVLGPIELFRPDGAITL